MNSDIFTMALIIPAKRINMFVIFLMFAIFLKTGTLCQEKQKNDNSQFRNLLKKKQL